MTPVREQRQRAAARARLEQQMAERLEAARKRRQRNIYLGGGLGLLLVAGFAVWGITALVGDDKPAASPSAAAGCTWLPEDITQNPNLKDVGTPPANEPRAGTRTMTMTTGLGVIEAELDVAHAPCASASFAHLASKNFFDNTKCHRMVDTAFKILQCGGVGKNPGSSGPTYKYAEENLPTGRNPVYERGMIAMAKTSQPSSTGSQFFLIDQDIPLSDGQTQGLTADYTVVGKITKGLDILDKVIAGGTFITNAEGKVLKEEAQDGSTWTAPKIEVLIKTLTVGPVVV